MSDRVETSLAVTYAIIKHRVGRILAYPDDVEKWTKKQNEAADNVIEDGLRQYYQPPAVDEFGPHQWSFMYPVITFETVADQRWYPAPDGFTGEITGAGGFTYTGDSKAYRQVKVTSAAHLAKLASGVPSSTGYPAFAAVKSVSDRGITEQQWEIGFHPTPDAAYEFQYQCYMEPYMLTDERQHPLGGQAYAQGILLSCLAAAEMYEFDQQGTHYQAFISQLKSDIQKDARGGPSTLGYGGVHRRGTVSRGSYTNRRSNSGHTVTYNDQTWD